MARPLTIWLLVLLAGGVLASCTSPQPTPTPTPTPTQVPDIQEPNPDENTPATTPVVQVEWQKIINPTLPPAEEGFYSGLPYVFGGGYQATEEAKTFAEQRLGPIPEENLVNLAIARDSANNNTVFAGITIHHNEEVHSARKNGTFLDTPRTWNIWLEGRLFVSIDGERSWREVSVIPYPNQSKTAPKNLFIEMVRVAERDESIVLYASDGTTWWQTILPLSSLP